VEGKYDDLPEHAFYMKGRIEEVLEAAGKLRPAPTEKRKPAPQASDTSQPTSLAA
jgi:hypothetical protein